MAVKWNSCLLEIFMHSAHNWRCELSLYYNVLFGTSLYKCINCCFGCKNHRGCLCWEQFQWWILRELNERRVIVICILPKDKQDPHRLVWSCGLKEVVWNVSVPNPGPLHFFCCAGFWVTAQYVMGGESYSPVLPCFAVSGKINCSKWSQSSCLLRNIWWINLIWRFILFFFL